MRIAVELIMYLYHGAKFSCHSQVGIVQQKQAGVAEFGGNAGSQKATWCLVLGTLHPQQAAEAIQMNTVLCTSALDAASH